ncbi:MAG: DUF2061 domain-containing protein [Neisseria sp.]|nr:DUF2061 domain-containing protein [Neisseria sp.]
MMKTLTFAILHFTVAFSIAYILTGSITVSGAVALIEPVVNTVVFYFHEKAWVRYEKKKGLRRTGLAVPLHQCVAHREAAAECRGKC